MAKVTEDSPFYGITGKVGDYVVKKRKNGTTYLASRPKNGGGTRSENQKVNEERFALAVDYAINELRRPMGQLHYEAYKKDAQSAYHAAIRDFMCGPTVEHVEVAREGNRLRVIAEVTDDTQVVGCCISYEWEGETVYADPEIMEGWDMYFWEIVDRDIDELTIHAIDQPVNVGDVLVKVKEERIEVVRYE
ncbi:hypothetical protein AB9P05_09670 [Roseivirga sp. BDSF3-8]|uniref:hypothetical protein n=1 Tax=Roseivirga sp. BDSF3-8 TaxID=3241598 RepID=UPI0035324F31